MQQVDYLNNLKKSFAAIKWYEWIMIAVMIFVAGEQLVSSLTASGDAHNPAWLAAINFLSAICGVICIFFTAKASVSACIFGIINTIVYSIYLAYWNIYGTLCLEVFVYLPVSVWQWVIWARKRDPVQNELTLTKRLTTNQSLMAGAIVVILGILYWQILTQVGGSIPLLDAFTVSIGIVAIILCMRRFREQYILWLITDIIAVAMYTIMFDPVYFTKKTIYLIMAFVGLYNWYRLNAIRNERNE